MKRTFWVLCITLVAPCTCLTSLADTQFDFDRLHRVTRAAYNDGTIVEYEYDAVGNRLSIIVTPPPCPGDINGDRQTDLSDLTLLLSAFGSCTNDAAFVPAADFDGSGCIELSDLSVLLANFGTVCP